MEKNTILAVVLSVVVITGFYLVQGIFFPQTRPAPPPVQERAPVTEAPAETSTESPGDSFVQLPDAGIVAAPEEQEPLSEQRITVETELIRVVLSNVGGDVISYQLKEHNDQGSLVEMVLPGDKPSHAFTVAFGGPDVQPVQSLFKVRQSSAYVVEFAREFSHPGGGGRFILLKKYEFKPDEYMFELTITLNGGPGVSGYNFGGAAYTLEFGPQIGPQFQKLDQRYEYRQYYTYEGGKRKAQKVSERESARLQSTLANWSAIAGKYFTAIAIPLLNTPYGLILSARPEPGLPAASRIIITRPGANISALEDHYRFYLGPKTTEALNPYYTGKNGFGINDMRLIEVANSRGVLAPLEWILKRLLMLFFRIIPNYGVAIILLTIFVKIVMFPLTKKQSESTVKMQALAPRIKEIQSRYKDNPQKMNQEMSEFYKKEGYNPLSGCLPMIIQIPIFFAMYNLFNNHFDLRGAGFIPGWIPDLSLPESVYHFTSFQLPFLGWTDVRALPFIYVGSQLLYGMVTQTPEQQGNNQMKMMLYVMPVVFFFILYDVPSGLLIYWIMSNLLTLVQQVGINKFIVKK
jgi:YidC/Oxa1 family membrane protein insertase